MELIEVRLQLNTNLRPAPSVDNVTIKTYPAGTLAYGDEIVVLTHDLYNGTVKIGMVNDKWLKVTRINTTTVNGYMALQHMGTTNKYPIIIRDDRENTTPDTPPDTTPVLPEFAEEFVMSIPGAGRGYYQFVRVLEDGEEV
jgi:hypothetical protein